MENITNLIKQHNIRDLKNQEYGFAGTLRNGKLFSIHLSCWKQKNLNKSKKHQRIMATQNSSILRNHQNHLKQVWIVVY